MLGECHAHIIMNGKNYKEAVALHKDGVREEVIRAHFRTWKEMGITFVRDGGDALGVSRRAKALALEYGIDYRTPIFAIHKKGHYGGIVGHAFSKGIPLPCAPGKKRRCGFYQDHDKRHYVL